MRKLQALVVVAAVVGAAAASVGAHGSAPHAVGRPNPLLTNLSLDYAQPLTARGGGAAALPPLGSAVLDASVRDSAFLRYRPDDWGGFANPPFEGSALGLGGGLSSRVFVYGGAGKRVGHRPPTAPTPPSTSTTPRPRPPLPSSNPVPCANSGFGGTACGASQVRPLRAKPHHTHKRKHKRPRLRVRGRCGKRGISIVSDLPHCRFAVLNGVPGYGTVEHLRIKNTTKRRFRLSFKAKGTPTPLWGFLELGVWRTGKAAPTPLPPLGFWTHRFTRLLTVKPGKTIRYTIELYLPASAGNAAQDQAAKIAFVWRAVGR